MKRRDFVKTLAITASVIPFIGIQFESRIKWDKENYYEIWYTEGIPDKLKINGIDYTKNQQVFDKVIKAVDVSFSRAYGLRENYSGAAWLYFSFRGVYNEAI